MLFLDPLLESCFAKPFVFFGVSVGSLCAPQVLLGLNLEETKFDAKREWRQAEVFWERGGVWPYDNVWSGAVLDHGAFWSLDRGRGDPVGRKNRKNLMVGSGTSGAKMLKSGVSEVV